MENLHAMEFAEMENGLAAHLSCNFYPPLPEYVKQSTIEGIKAFNEGTITIEELQDKCYLRSIEALYRYFGAFLRSEFDEAFDDY